MHLDRHPANPILEPIPDHPWEARNVFNCGVLDHEGKVVLIYRGQGWDTDMRMLSEVRAAVGRNVELKCRRCKRTVLIPLEG